RTSGAQLDCGRTYRGALAGIVLPPDLQLDLVTVDPGDPSATAVRVAWPVDSALADLERLQRPAIAEPIRDELAEERSFQKPVKDDTPRPRPDGATPARGRPETSAALPCSTVGWDHRWLPQIASHDRPRPEP